jgi:glucose/arabinose dehydrogenase
LSLYTKPVPIHKGQHFGSRIVFDKEGFLYFSAGRKGEPFCKPQDITRDNGKIYRLNDDGVFKDNPFVGQENAKEAIYTYGNRNPGLALNPFTGDIWEHEHGPKAVTINIIKSR